MSRKRTDFGWYLVFTMLAVAAFAGIYLLSGKDAVGAAGLLVWNAFVFTFNLLARLVTSFAAILARGVGLRRVSRVLTMVGGIGLGYAGSVVLSDQKLARAQDWRDKLRLIGQRIGAGWRRLPLAGKVLLVAVMIAVQLYLHWILIVFPIGFLVPVVRRAWVQVADTAFGAWYWRMFGPWHRRLSIAARSLPVVRHLLGCTRLTRLRYLTAWRLWRHHPRYRRDDGGRIVDLIEPLRLWRLGELDHYINRPLLSGARQPAGEE
ncbi:MAG: hypothetical protein RLZ98_813 [Pseudomonadota bacterium]|jgi:hypothetical protein